MKRLNKFIAHSIGLSRREADQAISDGRVKINRVTASLGAQVGPGDSVTFDDKPVQSRTEYTYLLLNKPVGYVCSRRQQGDSPTIYDLLPRQYRSLKPVGRLDRDSSGLLLLTDDGDFAHKMTHPRFAKTKIYTVELDQPLQPLHMQMINDHGISLADGPSHMNVSRLDDAKTNTERYQVTMSEGRNRQIRRTFLALGYQVTKLHRIQFGQFSLTDLEHKKYRLVSV